MRREFRVENVEDFDAVEQFVRQSLGCEARGTGGFLRSAAFVQLRLCAAYGRQCVYPVTALMDTRALRVSLESRGMVVVENIETRRGTDSEEA